MLLNKILLESEPKSGIYELVRVLVELCFKKTIYYKNLMLIHCKYNNRTYDLVKKKKLSNLFTYSQVFLNLFTVWHKYTSTFCSLHHNTIEHAPRFYGYILLWCVHVNVCLHSLYVQQEHGSLQDRMLKHWIHTNGPDSISVPLLHQDSCANRH